MKIKEEKYEKKIFESNLLSFSFLFHILIMNENLRELKGKFDVVKDNAFSFYG